MASDHPNTVTMQDDVLVVFPFKIILQYSYKPSI